jgi:hypothetical protein
MAEATVLGGVSNRSGSAVLANAKAVPGRQGPSTGSAVFEEFTPAGGPFPPDDLVMVIDPIAVSASGGEAIPEIIFEVNELDAQGNVVDTVAKGQKATDEGLTKWMYAEPNLVDFGRTRETSSVVFPTPGPGEKFYVGARTYTDNETPPNYPSPTVAARTAEQSQQLLPGWVPDDVANDEGVALGLTAAAGLSGALLFNQSGL